MITLDEMVDNACNQPPEPQISREEIQALYEEARNGTLKIGIYVSPQEYAKEYLTKSKQTLFV